MTLVAVSGGLRAWGGSVMDMSTEPGDIRDHPHFQAWKQVSESAISRRDNPCAGFPASAPRRTGETAPKHGVPRHCGHPTASVSPGPHPDNTPLQAPSCFVL
jgi:hypothetical protein